ncbi:MAG: OB-fold nucleic acid binding domain-containing protein, partial [Dehalococcoidia bacterium]
TPISYPHPDLEEILEETYGIIVYQDQVLHILRKFAGYTLGSADIVRKAMGKKIASLMQQEREKFVKGALEQGYGQTIAEQVFDLIEPFAGYAFNKAHSVSYAVVAYWTAYFKANYPVEYMTCVLNAYDGNAEKASAVIAECGRLGIRVLPPDVSRSDVRFSVDNDEEGRPAIRYGLASIKNVGESAVSDLVAERHENGPFESLEDFARRAGSSVANRRVLESLARVGALGAFGHRGQLLANLDSILRLIQSEAQLKDSGQLDMFGQSAAMPMASIELVDADEPSDREVAAWERELLGVSLTSRPLDPRYAPADAILSKEQLESEPENNKIVLVGQVSNVRLQTDKQQRRIAFIALEIFDGSSVDVAVWARTYGETAEIWQEGAVLRITGPVRRRNDEISVHCDSAEPYDLPTSGDDAANRTSPPVEGPVMEEWLPPAVPAPQAPTPPAAAPQPATTHAGGNGNGRYVNGNGHSAAPNG